MKFLSTLILTLLLVSCNNVINDKQDEFNNLKKQAMDAHDAIMPKMSSLMDLSNKLSQQIDSTNQELIMTKKGELKKAHDDMMDWMRAYSNKFPYDYKLPDNIDKLNNDIKVLQNHTDDINELKDRTLKLIDQAQNILKK